MDEKIQLRINEIPAQHVGKGIVIVDPSVIKKYGWHAGQILEIVGSRKTYAKLWPGSMENNDFDYIRIDGITRQNVGAGIGDKVLVRSIEVVSAEQIVLSPTEKVRTEGLQGYMKENFLISPCIYKTWLNCNILHPHKWSQNCSLFVVQSTTFPRSFHSIHQCSIGKLFFFQLHQ